MLPYAAPQQDMLFSLLDVAEGERLLDPAKDLDRDTLAALLAEAARLAESELAPEVRTSDLNPPKFKDRQVTVGPDMHRAQQLVSENGWIAMPFAEPLGGLGLPWSVSTLPMELLNAANVSFSLSVCMTQGCAEAILAHGSQTLIKTYVPGLLSGKYMGTMQLTESGAGSDVGALKTKAEPTDNQTWRLYGTKIFISWGDSDLTENVVQLVLARTPGAPDGTKGLSLFLVPKRLPDGRRNGVAPSGIENKLGLHGSPTCTMVHEGSTGWMVGKECGGMAAMFTMMNSARIGVGFQGLGVAERALQATRMQAQTRVQGGQALIHYPDVQRNLMTMKALVAASRDLGYSALVAGDLAALGGEDAPRQKRRIDLLTPIAKAFMSDVAIEVTNLAIQVHGGLGVVEEAGVAQLARDCRVFAIYEGTNGIQALDLAGRKTAHDQGRAAFELLDEMAAWLERVPPDRKDLATPLRAALEALRDTISWLVAQSTANPKLLAAAASPYLTAFSHLIAGWHMAKRALLSQAHIETDPAWATEQQALTAFYMGQLFPRFHLALTAISSCELSFSDLKAKSI